MEKEEKENTTPTGLNANDDLISATTLSINNLFIEIIIALPFNYFVVVFKREIFFFPRDLPAVIYIEPRCGS